MDKKNFGDWGIRLGALALACLLWFHAVTEHYYQKELTIRLLVEDPSSVSSGSEIMVASPVPDSVRVLVAGQGKDLLRLKKDDFLLRLKPSPGRPEEGMRSYRLTPSQVEQAAELGVQVREILDPAEVDIALDRRVHKEVEVVPRVHIEIADSYIQVGGIEVEPRRVRLSGPARQMGRIGALQTDSLVRRDVRRDVEAQTPLHLPENPRFEVSPSFVTLRIDVQERAEYEIANVPVQVRHAGGRNVVAEPSRVQVRVHGGADAIASLDPEKDLKLYVDYTEWLRSGGESQTVRAEANPLCEIRAIAPARVGLVERRDTPAEDL